MKTKLEKKMISEVESCTRNPRKETLDIIHNIAIMHIIRMFVPVLISTSTALFVTYIQVPNFIIYSFVVLLIVNLFALFVIYMDDEYVNTLHSNDLKEKLTYNTFIDCQLRDYCYLPVFAIFLYFMMFYILYFKRDAIVRTITTIYNLIISDIVIQISIFSISGICIGLYIYYNYKKKQVEQISQSGDQTSKNNLHIENYFNEEIFKEVWPFIQNDNITNIKWDGKTFWVTHKTKGRYKIPEITLSNEVAEKILCDLTNMVNIPFNEHMPHISTKIGNLIVHACHKTASTDSITTFLIEKHQ